ncbi:phosphate/phosphite/phosphonate ABC transporter substrate-binding protein [Magnetovibrio sp.]|uniref:phosphate/phosphite/phosphonate ABC transporter substrate-binding protein n=1 Tax=Magnetovibrio sp. TaxID=2024836 RepID=UPI002F958B43
MVRKMMPLWVLTLIMLCAGPVLAEQAFYRFGVVPQFEPRKLADIWLPIIAELEKRTGFKLAMVGSAEIPEFEKAFFAGDFDFAYMNPYHAMLAGESQGYVPLIRDHGRNLSGILVVAQDSPVKNITELEGQDVAFPSPNALGASLLMRAELETIHGVTVKPVYVQTHSSVYLNVVLGKTSAGGGVLSTLKGQKADIQDRLRVLYTTRNMAPHPLTAHPRVPEAHREAVRQAFLDLASTDEGKALVSRIPMKQPGIAKLEDYQVLKDWGLDKYYVE